ncbi:MAG: PAC2 family protein [Fervidicoccaceae archaeon]
MLKKLGSLSFSSREGEVSEATFPRRVEGRGYVVVEYGEVDLSGKVVVVGFPGMALVGKMAAEVLINRLGLTKVASLYSTRSPGAVPVEEGILKAAEITVYAGDGSPIAVVTSSYQPPSDESQNALAHEVLSYLSSRGAKLIISAAAYVSHEPPQQRRVFAAASNRRILEKLVKTGAIPMSGGISGLNGLVPALAPVYGMEGAALLGEAEELYVTSGLIDHRAAASVVELVARLLDIEIEVSDLIRAAEEIEKRITRVSREEAAEEAEERRPPPTHM